MRKKLAVLTLLFALLAGFVPWQRVAWPTVAAASESDFTIENGVLTKYKGSGGNVTIPDSVTSIGDLAFDGCTGLKSVTIGNGVKSIGGWTFRGCTGLTSITIPDSVTSIGGWTFCLCTGLTSITIGNSVTSIGSGAFYGCTGLTSITIPDGVTSIGEDAFCRCTGLTSITIPDSVTSIGEYAFESCTGLTSITIPDSVTSIGEDAFDDCTGLTSITIPDGVTSIGSGAFYGCTGLTSITIPASVTSIGEDAFDGCTGLTSIAVDANNKDYASRDGVLYDKEQTELIFCPAGKKGTFTIPDSVTSIGEDAFDDCTGLTSITIPDGVTSIGSGAFYGCTGLTSITIPASVTSIGEDAFDGCTGLTSIAVDANNKDYASRDGVLYNKSQTKLICCPAGKKGTFTIPDGVTSIGEDAFDGCTGLTSVTIPNSVTSIGKYAFHSCTGLTSITIPDSVTSIGKYAFSRCTGLTSITIPASVTSIGEDAFYGCTGLTSITIPDSVTSIGKYAFYRCTGLTSITIPDGVTSIGSGAFYGCTGLTSITIPVSVKEIGFYAFDECDNLKDVYYSGTREQWEKIDIQDNNEPLENATIHYNSTATPLAITAQPANVSGNVNGTAKFSLTATGSGLTYQWYVKKASDSTFTAWNKKTTASVSTPIYASWNKAQFYCLVKDGNGNSVKSNTVTLTVTPKITAQPASVSGNVNGTAKFSVTATGSGLTYQWYYKKSGASDWTKWNNQTKNAASLTVYNSWNKAQFYCVVKDANGKTVKSNTVTLTVVSIQITTQPASVSGNVNGTAKFSVTATGSGLTYQWYVKKASDSAFTAWNKKTSASVSTPIYASWNKAQFYCIVKDGSGNSLKSNTVTLTVTPKITQQPANASGAVNGTATFTVKATGNGLTYQWYYKKSGASDWTKWNYRTGTSASLTIYKSWNGAQFYCVVKDANGKSVKSSTAALTVK